MKWNKPMMMLTRISTGFVAATLFCLLAASAVTSQTVENKARSFATAQDAANALIESNESADEHGEKSKTDERCSHGSLGIFRVLAHDVSSGLTLSLRRVALPRRS